MTPWQYLKRSTPRLVVAASLLSGFVATTAGPAAAQDPPTFTIIKDVVPNQEQDFTFTATGPIPQELGDGIFQLDDDGSEVNDLPSSATFPLPPNPEGSGLDPYVITETPVEGFELTSIACFLNGVPQDPADFLVTDEGGNPIGVTGRLNLDDNALCVFTNAGGPSATFTIVKDTRPNQPQDFVFDASGPFVPEGLTFDLDDDGDETNELPSRQTFILAPNSEGSGLDPYIITEEPVEGFTLSTIACTINGVPVPLADIQVLGEGGELIGVAGRVAEGDEGVCVFVNEGGPAATFTIEKDTQPDSDQDFLFSASGPFIPEGTVVPLDDDGTEANPLSSSQTFVLAPNPVESGLEPYVITEGLVPGFDLDTIECAINGVPQALADIQVLDEGGNLIGISGRLADGDTAVCTFVNVAVDDDDDDDDGDDDYEDYPGDSDFDFDTPFDDGSDDTDEPDTVVAGNDEQPAAQQPDPAPAVLAEVAGPPAPAVAAAPLAVDTLPRTGAPGMSESVRLGVLLLALGGLAIAAGRRRKAASRA